MRAGDLFDQRYYLIKRLGEGASAEVWKAADSKANNLIVAVKIFSASSGMDTYGIQNFASEFTAVHDLNHTNLLKPLSYDICKGTPYLILQYCENGSAKGMIGQAEEEDVIKLLHDVAAGLEYLHEHDIVHQDIKPDNILLDDNCNFLVTDFGISVASTGDVSATSGSAGTTAYMAPERFEGTPAVKASDIWSLGATAFELATGDVPFGDYGGMVQASGEFIPSLPANYQPEVKEIITACLAQQPWDRPFARYIRQKIEVYWETGSWKRKDMRNVVWGIAASIAILILCAGLYYWDYNRTKIYYYKDYAEFYAIPYGLGKLSKNEYSHKEQSYQFEFKQGKLRKLSLVNSAGKVISHTDTEHMNSRFSEVHYFYTDNGRVDYKEVYDSNGKMLYKMDYDENMKTVTFRQNDEYGTEMNLEGSTTQLINRSQGGMEEKSRITRFLLSFNRDGLLTERKFVGLQNVPSGDNENIYGNRYKYDGKGRVVEEAFLGIEGSIKGNKIGLAVKRFTYDKNDNWESVAYLTEDYTPSHDGNYCSLVKLEYDEYGNRIKESYYTLDGKPSIRKDLRAAEIRYNYDKHGFQIQRSFAGIDGMISYCSNGFAIMKDSFNEDGFVVQRCFYDEYENPVRYVDDDMSYSSLVIEPNSTGLPLSISYYDEFDNPIEINGVNKIGAVYDSIGNCIENTYYTKDGQPALFQGIYSKRMMRYDEFNRMISESFYDNKQSRTSDDSGVSEYKLEYNRQGGLVKLLYFDTKGNPTLGSNRTAGFEYEFDDLGNHKSIQYFGLDGKPCMSSFGYAIQKYEYDEKTNFLKAYSNLDAKGKVIGKTYYSHDDRGNVLKNYTVNGNGNLLNGTVVEIAEYNKKDLRTSEWATDLRGNRINYPGYKFSMVRYSYDEMGNCTETTYWDTSNKPTVDGQFTHKRIHEFDNQGRIVYERNLGVNDKPLTSSTTNPEGRVKYDQYGNMAEITCYDGNGNPRLSSDGYFKRSNEYNRRNLLVNSSYWNIDGKLIVPKSQDYAKVVKEYDDKGNLINDNYYNGKNVCFRIERYTYNEKNQMTEMLVLTGEGKRTDKFYGVSRVVIEYDESGQIPKTRKWYDINNTIISIHKYNLSKQEWQDSSSNSSAKTDNNWQEEIASYASQCPVKINENVTLQSITYNSNSITITIKLNTISKYDMDDDTKSQINDAKKNVKDALNIPSSVNVTLRVIDKADREI